MSISGNNKRIVKNTMLLYVRMFIMMAISLYTSRVILQILGVEDFGIYNVVGGVVVMMSYFQNVMGAATSRYLNFALGKHDEYLSRKTFNSCFQIYVFISILVLLLGETIGVWFINNKLVIPTDRIFAANCVYQFSLVSCINAILTSSYNAVIISRERMGVFAYLSIIEAILKLAVIGILVIVDIDRFGLYGFLMMLIALFNTLLYRTYCIRHFKESHLLKEIDYKYIKEILSYTGWNIFGTTASLAKGQGLNILLNMFFNPAVNAARGIAYQVNGVINQFSNNFFTAVRPQITKYYANGDMDNMLKLVFRSSMMNFGLILILALPLTIEAPFFIKLWLGQLPEYTVEFFRLIVVVSAIDGLAQPLMTTAQATGRIALYQVAIGITIMLNIPISYLFLNFGYPPVTVFIVSIIISMICVFIRLFVLKYLINFPVYSYIRIVLLRSLMVFIASSILPFFAYIKLSNNLYSAISVCGISVLCSCFALLFIGLDRTERTSVLFLLKSRLFNRKNLKK